MVGVRTHRVGVGAASFREIHVYVATFVTHDNIYRNRMGVAGVVIRARRGHQKKNSTCTDIWTCPDTILDDALSSEHSSGASSDITPVGG